MAFVSSMPCEAQQTENSNLSEVLECAIVQYGDTNNALEITISTQLGLGNITLEDVREIDDQSSGTKAEKPKGYGWTHIGHLKTSDWKTIAERLIRKLESGPDYIIRVEPADGGYIDVYYKKV